VVIKTYAAPEGLPLKVDPSVHAIMVKFMGGVKSKPHRGSESRIGMRCVLCVMVGWVAEIGCQSSRSPVW
jgi:hypothetical protein